MSIGLFWEGLPSGFGTVVFVVLFWSKILGLCETVWVLKIEDFTC